MDFELLNVFSGFQIGAKLNGRGDATTKLEMICLQVRKLNFLNEMQLGDFPVSHTTDDIAQGCMIWWTTGPLVAENFLDWQKNRG